MQINKLLLKHFKHLKLWFIKYNKVNSKFTKLVNKKFSQIKYKIKFTKHKEILFNPKLINKKMMQKQFCI